MRYWANFCIAIVCFPDCNVIIFGINLIFIIRSLFLEFLDGKNSLRLEYVLKFPSFFWSLHSHCPHSQIWMSIHISDKSQSSQTKKLYDPFLWMGFNCLKATEPLQGGSLLFIIQFSTLKGWKDELALEPPSGFEPGTHWIGNAVP